MRPEDQLGPRDASLGPAVDAFLAAWSEKDEGRRRTALAAIATDDVGIARVVGLWG